MGHFFSGNVKETRILRPLNTFPQRIGEWKLANRAILSPEVGRLLGVDDYIQYDYVDSVGRSVSLYVSYFGRVGIENKGYHSPKNCLPGAGWNVIASDHLKFPVRSLNHDLFVNKLTVQKGPDREIVFYWYQCRGRYISSEYMDKVYLVVDSVMKGRSDGAFIRLSSPVINNGEVGTVSALKDFTIQIVHLLDNFIPGT